MSICRYAMVGLILGFWLAGCGSKSNNSPAPKTIIPDPKVEEISSDNYQAVALNLAETNRELVKSNSVSLKGSGTKSTYKIIYEFNSGGYSSFKVIETKLKSSGCSGLKTKMYLKGKNFSREVSVLDQVDVTSNTDYVLEVVAGHSCAELEMTFDVIAWVGSRTEDPKIGSLCFGQPTFNAIFIANVNVMTAFSSIIGREKYLSIDSYCGEPFRGTTTECTGAANIFLPDFGPTLSHAECKAEKDGETRSFSVDFDAQEKTAFVVCKSGDKETSAELFRGCRSLIVDYKAYK